MLKKIILSLSIVSATAFAADNTPDYYTGFQLGYGNTQNGSANLTLNHQAVSLIPNKHSGVAGRLFVGYAVTSFYAMEMGLENYNSASWHTTVGGQNIADTSLSLYGADIAMRFSWINQSTFSVYNTLGLTYILANYGSYSNAFQLNKARYFLRPEMGIGGNYNVTNNTQINVAYRHVFGRGHLNSAVNASNSGDYLPTIGLTSVGVIYNF